MNLQPYDTPPKFWPPKLNPHWFRLLRWRRERDLRRQKIRRVELQGLEQLRQVLDDGCGVLLTPNHSFHYDSYCLLRAADAVKTPFYTMTAWQVFGMAGPWARYSMQLCGAFSVNREGTDLEAYRTATELLRTDPRPLIIFPEGDIYHTNDRLTPFRDGAAAIALSAARKAKRRVVCIPVAIKCWYLTDPTRSMQLTLENLERRLWWRPSYGQPLAQRIFRVAEGLLALKEYEQLGQPQLGTLAERTRRLAEHVLDKHERRLNLPAATGHIPERVKEIRRRIIQAYSTPQLTDDQRRELAHDMDDMFFVTQLYSYPGEYISSQAAVERLAETVDKLEEDVLGVEYPAVRGERRVIVRFGTPIHVTAERGKRQAAERLTTELENRVQQMLDALNGQASEATGVGER